MAVLPDLYGAYHTKSASAKDITSAFHKDLDDGLREHCTVLVTRPKDTCTFLSFFLSRLNKFKFKDTCTFQPVPRKNSALSVVDKDNHEAEIDAATVADEAATSDDSVAIRGMDDFVGVSDDNGEG